MYCLVKLVILAVGLKPIRFDNIYFLKVSNNKLYCIFCRMYSEVEKLARLCYRMSFMLYDNCDTS